jgi:predicted nucleic acid-binding protein
MFPLVVDVNVIISSLLRMGNSLLVFKMNPILKRYDLISPEFAMIEFNNHSSEIAQRSRLSIEEATKVMDFISKQIRLVSKEEFSDKLKEAREILKDHIKDLPYLALALKFNCNIFSGDRIFKDICPDKVKTPKEILEEFYE